MTADKLQELRKLAEKVLAWGDITATEHELADAIIELIEALAGWKIAVEGLTPSGSEFVNDPKACGDYIRERSRTQHRLVIENINKREAAEARLSSLREAARPFLELGLAKGYAETEALKKALEG